MESFVVDKITKKYKFVQGIMIFGFLVMWLLPYGLYVTGEEGWTFERSLLLGVGIELAYLLTIIGWMYKIRNFKIVVNGNDIEIIRRGKPTIKTTPQAMEGFETFFVYIPSNGSGVSVSEPGIILCVNGERIFLERYALRNYDVFEKFINDKGKFIKHRWYKWNDEVDKDSSPMFENYAKKYAKKFNRVI